MFRSAAPLTASEEDVRVLRKELKINTYLDLRSERETMRNPFNITLLKARPNEGRAPNYYNVNIIKSRTATVKVLVKAAGIRATAKLMSSMPAKKWREKAISEFSTKIDALALYKIIVDNCGAELASALQVFSNPENYPVMFFCR